MATERLRTNEQMFAQQGYNIPFYTIKYTVLHYYILYTYINIASFEACTICPEIRKQTIFKRVR